MTSDYTNERKLEELKVLKKKKEMLRQKKEDLFQSQSENVKKLRKKWNNAIENAWGVGKIIILMIVGVIVGYIVSVIIAAATGGIKNTVFMLAVWFAPAVLILIIGIVNRSRKKKIVAAVYKDPEYKKWRDDDYKIDKEIRDLDKEIDLLEAETEEYREKVEREEEERLEKEENERAERMREDKYCNHLIIDFICTLSWDYWKVYVDGVCYSEQTDKRMVIEVEPGLHVVRATGLHINTYSNELEYTGDFGYLQVKIDGSYAPIMVDGKTKTIRPMTADERKKIR